MITAAAFGEELRRLQLDHGFPVGETRKRDLGLSPADLDAVRAKVNAGCQVLGLRFREDGLVGNRFETLHREFGDNFIAVEFRARSTRR
ncbi:hypothetical protein FXW78_13200 [Rhodococcus opacus]|nr:hypothetical protein [Rhodococcus opacus]RZL79220.1 MAG: hypothetical protein EOP32_20015 [Rhodococcus sp. (in: high G+C Gram-positive bacteria)]